MEEAPQTNKSRDGGLFSVRRVHSSGLTFSRRTPGGPLALKDDLVLVSFMILKT